MAGKRIARIAAFTFLNVAVFWLVVFWILTIDDSCNGCYTLSKSKNLEAAIENGSIINEYGVLKSNFQYADEMGQSLKQLRFWTEKAKMVSEDGETEHPTEVLVWSSVPQNGKYKFSVVAKEKTIQSTSNYDYLFIDHTALDDTFKVEVFREEVVVNRFRYLKVDNLDSLAHQKSE